MADWSLYTRVMSTAAQYTELCKRKIKSILAHIHNTYELYKHNQKYNLKSSQGTLLYKQCHSTQINTIIISKRL